MSSFASLGIVVLSALVMASLQLSLGTLLLLYHASLGKNIREKTKRLAGSYISGATLAVFILLSATCFLVLSLTLKGTFSTVSLVAIFGMLLSLTLISWFFYYKKKGSTELWLPKKVSKFLDSRAKETEDTSEAFSLGVLTFLSEIIFSAPLFLVSADSILALNAEFQALSLVLFVLISVLPLVVLRIVIRSGKNVADIQRWRLKNKNFFRLFAGFGYLVLAAFLFAFKILGGIS